MVLAQTGRHGGDPCGGARRQRYRDPQVVAPLIAVPEIMKDELDELKRKERRRKPYLY